MLAGVGGPTFTVTGWAASIGTIAFLITAILVIVHSPLARPVRWVYRRLVGQPVTAFFAQVVGDIVEEHTAPLRYELSPNGGNSLVDKVNKLVESADDSNARLVKIEEDRKEQVPVFIEDHERLQRLEKYAHEQNHARQNDITTLQLARDVLTKVPNATP